MGKLYLAKLFDYGKFQEKKVQGYHPSGKGM